MSSRNEEKDIFIEGKRVVGGIQAARILTERAKSIGSTRRYSRDTIYKHYTSGRLKPAMEAPAGNLYYVEDIEKLPITPSLGKKSKNQFSKDTETGTETP